MTNKGIQHVIYDEYRLYEGDWLVYYDQVVYNLK